MVYPGLAPVSISSLAHSSPHKRFRSHRRRRHWQFNIVCCCKAFPLKNRSTNSHTATATGTAFLVNIVLRGRLCHRCHCMRYSPLRIVSSVHRFQVIFHLKYHHNLERYLAKYIVYADGADPSSIRQTDERTGSVKSSSSSSSLF